jgi:hypothetical protein
LGQFPGHPFDASFFLNNAFDKTYAVGADALLNLTGTSATIYAPPRMWGVEHCAIASARTEIRRNNSKDLEKQNPAGRHAQPGFLLRAAGV